MRNLRTYTFSLQANVAYPFDVDCNVSGIISSESQFTMDFDNGNKFVQMESGIALKFEESYNRVTLTSTTAQTVYIILGFGSITDARATLNAVINTTIEPSNTFTAPGDVSVSTTAVQLIAADTNTKEVEISVPSTSSFGVRVGPSGVTNTSGSLIEPGMSKWLSFEGALYGIREASATADVTVTVSKLSRV
jgi:hypothetical protein